MPFLSLGRDHQLLLRGYQELTARIREELDILQPGDTRPLPERVHDLVKQLERKQQGRVAVVTTKVSWELEPDGEFLHGVKHGLDRAWAEVAVARPISEYHEDFGEVLWWRFPVDEPPYVGRPDDSGWPDPPYHTHWTQILVPQDPGTPEAANER